MQELDPASFLYPPSSSSKPTPTRLNPDLFETICNGIDREIQSVLLTTDKNNKTKQEPKSLLFQGLKAMAEAYEKAAGDIVPDQCHSKQKVVDQDSDTKRNKVEKAVRNGSRSGHHHHQDMENAASWDLAWQQELDQRVLSNAQTSYQDRTGVINRKKRNIFEAFNAMDNFPGAEFKLDDFSAVSQDKDSSDIMTLSVDAVDEVEVGEQEEKDCEEKLNMGEGVPPLTDSASTSFSDGWPEEDDNNKSSQEIRSMLQWSILPEERTLFGNEKEKTGKDVETLAWGMLFGGSRPSAKDIMKATVPAMTKGPPTTTAVAPERGMTKKQTEGATAGDDLVFKDLSFELPAWNHKRPRDILEDCLLHDKEQQQQRSKPSHTRKRLEVDEDRHAKESDFSWTRDIPNTHHQKRVRVAHDKDNKAIKDLTGVSVLDRWRAAGRSTPEDDVEVVPLSWENLQRTGPKLPVAERRTNTSRTTRTTSTTKMVPNPSLFWPAWGDDPLMTQPKP